MGQDDQQPIRCDGCGIILSQIQKNIWDMKPQYEGWKQIQNYWSVELHFWIKDIEPGKRGPKHRENEHFHLCNTCKKRICNLIGKK